MNTTHKVREQGKNGSVIVTTRGLTRVIKKTFGKDDEHFIPFSKIDQVQLDRHMLTADTVTVFVGMSRYEWKTTTASDLTACINEELS